MERRCFSPPETFENDFSIYRCVGKCAVRRTRSRSLRPSRRFVIRRRPRSHPDVVTELDEFRSYRNPNHETRVTY